MKEDCNHDVIAWRDEYGTARIWGCYRCKVKFVPVTQLEDEVQDEREACAKVCEDFYQGLPPKLTVRGYLEDMAKAIRARGNT